MVGAPVAAAFASQAQGPAVKACSVLTRDLVEPLTANKSVLDLSPPEEQTMSSGGAACQWGSVRLQLWPPKSGAPRASPGKEYQTVPGAGELAYFRSNRDRYAELMVWSATRYFTLQVSVPTGSTAEAVKPRVVTLANQILAKLK
jgi:hypothetical protein